MNDDAPSSARAPLVLDLVVRRHRFWPAVLTLASCGVGIAALGYYTHNKVTALLYGFFTIASVAVTALVWSFAGALRQKSKKHVTIDPSGVSANGKSLISSSEMNGSAYLYPREKDLLVYFPARQFWKTMALAVDDEQQGLEVLTSLGQDPKHALARFRLASGFQNPTLRTIVTIAFGMSQGFSTCGNWHGPYGTTIGFLYLALIAFSGASFLLPTHVTIGADGVLIRRFGRRRFISFGEISSIDDHEKYQDAIVISLSGREKVTLRTSVRDSQAANARNDVTRALQKRLELALATFRNRETAPAALDTLKRANQSTAEWISSLRKASSVTEYRVMAISTEQLWSTLEDPAASPDDRAAALIALRQSLDEKGLKRARKEIEACAEPRLRIALDAAILEKDAELEAALDAMNEEEQAAKRL